MWSSPPAKLTAAARTLLRQIADHDHGSGVLFEVMPRARWAHPNTLAVFNSRTFYPLADRGLIDVGNGHTDPVKLTAAGRAYLEGPAQ